MAILRDVILLFGIINALALAVAVLRYYTHPDTVSAPRYLPPHHSSVPQVRRRS